MWCVCDFSSHVVCLCLLQSCGVFVPSPVMWCVCDFSSHVVCLCLLQSCRVFVPSPVMPSPVMWHVCDFSNHGVFVTSPVMWCVCDFSSHVVCLCLLQSCGVFDRYTEHSMVGLAQQWDQLNQLAMRMQHNLEQQIDAWSVFTPVSYVVIVKNQVICIVGCKNSYMHWYI